MLQMAAYGGRSHAKINVFLKITGQRGSYHELLSRFIRVAYLFDEINFIEDKCSTFQIEGKFSCDKEKNTIYLAFKHLLKHVNDSTKVKSFFKAYKVVVTKRIKENGGLGGGSSNAATFLRMTNEACRLGMSIDELCYIGARVGADVPFFIHDIDSANIKGIGEVVETFSECVPKLEIVTPEIKCNTGKVYAQYRQFHYKEEQSDFLENIERMESTDILHTFSCSVANDLCVPTSVLYPEMNQYLKDDWFMSGSGSTVFRLRRKDKVLL